MQPTIKAPFLVSPLGIELHPFVEQFVQRLPFEFHRPSSESDWKAEVLPWLSEELNRQPSPLLRRLASQLQLRIHEGETLFHAWPRAWWQSVQEQIGLRWYWCRSRSIESGPMTAFVSSLSRRGIDRTSEWNRAFFDAVMGASRRQHRLGYVAGGLLGTRTRHVAQRLKLASVCLELPEEGEPFCTWLAHRMLDDSKPTYPGEDTCWISPPISRDLCPSQGDDPTVPLVDRISVLLPDVIHAVSVRGGGNIESLLTRRLNDQRYPPATVRVQFPANPPREKNRMQATRQLVAIGAVGWTNFVNAYSYQSDQWIHRWLPKRCDTLAPILNFQKWTRDQQNRPWTWLTHCTRARMGKWPNESEDQRQDDLLLGDYGPVDSPFETLLRILAMGKILSTSHLKRCNTLSISFSAKPLAPLLSQRRFRSHLGRWDWEPYGICIKRPCLEGLGARPVIYGKETDYSKLSIQDRVFFQIASGNRSGQSWEEEQEWRLGRTLRLMELDASHALIFVPTLHEANLVAKISGFPVLVVGHQKLDVTPEQTDRAP